MEPDDLARLEAPTPVLCCRADGTVVAANAAARRWLDGATNLAERFDGHAYELVRGHLVHAATSDPDARTSLVVPARTHFVQLTSVATDGGVAVSVADVTRLQAEIDQLRGDLLTDPLTGVANRSLLQDHLRRALARPDRGTGPVALLYCDLDRFKVVNDRHGHAVGDELLRQVAHRITEVVRPADVVARIGGDEFVVLSHDARLDRAQDIARRIIERVGEPYEIGPDRTIVRSSISIGIALEEHDADEHTALAHADAAMYAAKAQGRARTVVYADEIQRWWVDRETRTRTLMAAHLELRQRYEDLARKSLVDERTGLPGASQFERDLEDLHQPGNRYGIVFFDVDRFHDYNSRFTHLGGHEALARVAAIAAETIGDDATCYRYGGEEFAVLARTDCLAALVELAERVRSAVAGMEIVHPDAPGGVLTVSAGVAIGDGDDPDVQSAVRAADVAMLRAKEAGRNRVCI